MNPRPWRISHEPRSKHTRNMSFASETCHDSAVLLHLEQHLNHETTETKKASQISLQSQLPTSLVRSNWFRYIVIYPILTTELLLFLLWRIMENPFTSWLLVNTVSSLLLDLSFRRNQLLLSRRDQASCLDVGTQPRFTWEACNDQCCLALEIHSNISTVASGYCGHWCATCRATLLYIACG